MRHFSISTIVLALTACIISCDNHQDSSSSTDNNGWDNDNHITKTIDNIIFTFPTDGWAFDKRDSLTGVTLSAFKNNLPLINLKEYTDTIRVVFLRSRTEIKRYTSMTGSGLSFPDLMTTYIVAKDEQKHIKAPIKHELMHLISMTTWGYPVESSKWMNEGLSTYAENNCNNYLVEQIYSYLADKNMLIPIDTMANDFYSQDEMIRNHQSAYIVQFLIDNYGVDKLKELWTKGFNDFEKIYGIPYRRIEIQLKEKVKQKYPTTPDINWDSFKKGCR